MPKYEIYQRENGQRRKGHLALLIDGIDAEITVDPSQFMEKATKELLEEDQDAKKAATGVEERALEMAEWVIQRKINSLRDGRVAGGVTLGNGFKTEGVTAYTANQRRRGPRNGESQAVDIFLNRGKLKGLDKSDRAKRLKAPNHDSYKEWLESRTALIAKRRAELKQWEAEHQKGNPKAEKNVVNLRNEIKALEAPVLNASHGLQYAFTQYMLAAIHFVNDDLRIWPLMTNTTLDTLRDAVDTFSDVTADEFDGANYSSGGLALDNQAVAVDDANDRAEFSADDEVVTNLGAGTRPIQGVALGKFNTNTALSLPLHWIEFASNKTPDGSNFTFDFSATDGILQMAG